MKKNEKFLKTFLMLNAVITGVAAAGTNNVKYEKMYEKMTKNISTNKSNKDNYQLIERILNQRNKELKDLHLQGDYIVKPEYLEWQIFFNSFADKIKINGKQENAVMYNEDRVKSVNFAMMLPIKEIQDKKIGLNISAIQPPYIIPSISQIKPVTMLSPTINLDSFTLPEAPVPLGIYFGTNRSSHSVPVGKVTSNVVYNTTGNSVYENLNVSSLTETEVYVKVTQTDITGTTDYSNASYTGTTAATSSYTHGMATFDVISIGNNGIFEVDGNWIYKSFPVTNSHTKYGFLSYKPYYVNADSKVTFSGNLSLLNKANYVNFDVTGMVGLSLNADNVTSNPTGKAILENKGTITLGSKSGSDSYYRMVGMQLESGSSYKIDSELINNGTITLTSNNNAYMVGMQINISNDDRYVGKSLVKIGNIKLERGELWQANGLIFGDIKNSGLVDSKIIVDGSGGLIDIEATGAVGISINRANKPQSSNNGMENFKNLNLLINGRGIVGIIRHTSSIAEDAVDMTVTEDIVSSIKFGSDARESVMFYPVKDTLILDASLKNSVGIINKGTRNAFSFFDNPYSTTTPTLKNYMPIEIGSGAEAATALGARGNGTLENHADIINNSSDVTESGIQYGAIGIFSQVSGTGTTKNYGSIDMNGKKATALYNAGVFLESKSDHILINNENGILIYSLNGDSNVSANKLGINGDNGVVAFSNGGNISLSPLIAGGTLELTANGENTYAFYRKSGTGKIKINGTINANVKNGGIGLHYTGTGVTAAPVNLGAELAAIIDSSGGTLNIITDSDSYNLTLKNTTVNLSNLSNLNFDNVTFTPDAKTKMYDGGLFVDIDSNIDKNNNTGSKAYRNTGMSASNVTVNSGITITGTENSLTAVGQDFSDIVRWGELANKGTISLSGDESTGIYGKKSTIENTGSINLPGKDTTAIYSVDSSVKNTGEIKTGDKGVGIYSEIDPYSFAILAVENDGKIEAGTGTGAVGIYSVLKNTNTPYYNHETILNTNSDIDMRKSQNSVGIYSIDRNVSGTDSGKISIGKDSYGVYVNNGDVSLNNLTLNISGDNSVGIYTNGTGSFSGNGTVNVDGKGIVILNIESTGTYNQNFTVNSTAGSSYIFQNLKNRTLVSNNTVNLGEGGTYINAVDSNVTLDINSDLNSFNTATGNYDSRMIGAVSSGGTGSITNKGIISFGDESAGLYARDGGQIINEGSISLGANSVGLYGEETGANITNDILAEINVRDNSVGIVSNNGDSITSSGKINGTGERVTGIYSDSINNTVIQVNGDITLTGNKSVGAYLAGTGLQTFTNNAVITSGSSNSDLDPAIGIYNNGSGNKIINNNTIKTGDNSVSIYNNGGEIIQNSGNITTGQNSVGIYTNSGKVSLLAGSMNINGADSVGIYASENAEIENNLSMTFTDSSYGIVANSGSKLINNSGAVIMGESSVFIYSKGGNEVLNKAGSDITLTGSNSSGIYTTDGTDIENHGHITADTGLGNIGISNKGGSVLNTGNIKTGDSIIIDEENTFLNTYSVGVYGENTKGFKNTGNIEAGYRGIGLYIKDNTGEALNSGDIKSDKEGVMGIYAENSTVKNTGNITLSGDESIGIAAAKKVTAVNSGVITMNGNNSIGIYANISSKIINEKTGVININGNNSTGIQLSLGSTLENYGQINMASGIYGSKDIAIGDQGYTPPSIVNAGVIMVDEKFEIDGINLTIKVDPDSLRLPTLEEITLGGYSPEDLNAGFLISNSTSIKAPSFDLGGNTTKIDPNFTQGTNMRVYKFVNVFDPSTPEGGPNTGEVAVESGSLTFDAIPVVNKDSGGIDIWMEKINYNKFTQGTWYNEFSENIESGYLNAAGDSLKLYDRLDLISTQSALNNDFEQLAGNVYSNIMQREQNIGGMFNNTLDILQNSENNTKENVKIGVVAGYGSREEKTSGVPDYDYKTYGVLGLREVERTYKHKFGYSLGYTQTNFEFDDSDSKDRADTFQIGVHNKYSTNGWNFKNDLLGRMSIHNVDRNIKWSDGNKSELSSDYNVYGVSSLNSAGREIDLGNNFTLEPYAGLELGYAVHSDFEEKDGIEKLKVRENDAYSVKPSAGIRFGVKKDIKDSGWMVKGNLGAAYEYELGDMNRQEEASVINIENGYHKLAKVSEDKGILKVNASGGVEFKERYGIYVTGEYAAGNDDREDYKIGVTLKASF